MELPVTNLLLDISSPQLLNPSIGTFPG